MAENRSLLSNNNGSLLSNNNRSLLSNNIDQTIQALPETNTWLKSWRETLVLTLSFMAAYTAFLAIQSLQSSLNQEAGLGVVSLACLYGTIILSGILTPSFLRLVGAKWSLVIGFFCHCLYTASNFYPTWGTLIPASVLLGAVSGPIWTSVSMYITTSGKGIAQRSDQDLHAVLSKVNGIFFMGYESTQITGNLISSLVLKQGTYSNNGTMICGADDCPTASNSTVIAEPESQIVDILLGVFLACDLVALGLTLFFLPPLQQPSTESECPSKLASQDDHSLEKTLLSWFKALSDPKMFFLVLFFLSAAMSQGILFVDFTKSFISCSLGVSMVGFIMASFGVVTSAVATVTSFAAKYTGRYFLFGLSFVCNMSMLLTLLLWKPNNNGPGVFFIISTIWGIAVGIFHTQFMALVGFMFPEKMAAAFANFHTWTAIGFTITFAYSGVLCVRMKLYVCIVAFGLGMLGYIVAEVIHGKQIHTTETQAVIPVDEPDKQQRPQ